MHDPSQYKDNLCINDELKFYIKDSIIFLKEFHKKIDLLYLDSFDGHDVEMASKHQFNEAKAVIKPQ